MPTYVKYKRRRRRNFLKAKKPAKTSLVIENHDLLLAEFQSSDCCMRAMPRNIVRPYSEATTTSRSSLYRFTATAHRSSDHERDVQREAMRGILKDLSTHDTYLITYPSNRYHERQIRCVKYRHALNICERAQILTERYISAGKQKHRGERCSTSAYETIDR